MPTPIDLQAGENASRMLSDMLTGMLSASLPRVLSLLDKNSLSSSYGCLDRKYWQYKIIDFPSGMQQELSRVLAWAWRHAPAGTPWRGAPRLREYAEASIRYHAKCMHPDGSLDDYFPWERALGATAYATVALTDACHILKWTPGLETIKALACTGAFLIRHKEAGVLANHHAIAACALLGLGNITGEPKFAQAAAEKIASLEKMQHPDGWFPEYEGCDIGYQTVTLEFLARCEMMKPGIVPCGMQERLLGFLEDFMHPDGSIGGEYASRGTYNFYPGGLALHSHGSDAAARMLGAYFVALQAGNDNRLEDDGIFGHMLSSAVTVLQAPSLRILFEDLEPSSGPWVREYEDCGLYRAGVGDLRLYGSLTKGGSFKLFKGRDLLCSDTGFAGKLSNGLAFCQNNPDSSTGTVDGSRIEVSGRMRPLRDKRLTVASMLILRLLCLLFGRYNWFSSAVRRLMQGVLIYNRKYIPVTFRRIIALSQLGVSVSDDVICQEGNTMSLLKHTTDHVNMHVVTSCCYQRANLLSWHNCKLDNATNYKTLRKW